MFSRGGMETREMGNEARDGNRSQGWGRGKEYFGRDVAAGNTL